jgi:hypothetical protein
MMKLETLHSACFLSDCLQCKDYYYTLYPLMCLTSENCMGSDLAKEKATVPCLLFCHWKLCKQHVKLFSIWAVVLSYWKSHRLSCNHTGFKKMVSDYNILVWADGLRKKIGAVIIVALTAHHIVTLATCDGSLWINVGLSADQYLFSESLHIHWDETKLEINLLLCIACANSKRHMDISDCEFL